MSGPNDTSTTPPPVHERGSARLFGRRRFLQTPNEALHPQQAPPLPPAPNSERRPILSAISGALSLALVAALVALAAVSYAGRKMAAPGPLATDKAIFIAPGTEVVQIIDKLAKEKVIENPTLVKGSLWARQQWRSVKAGEYLFKAHVSPNEVIDTLVSGKQVLHSVTIPEGLTSEQIIERLRANEILAGDIAETPKEGSLLPETYKVTRGTSRSSLIRKMQREQESLLDRIWAKRSKTVPLKSKYEMLTLAAIVEKETGRADERSRVAGVFYNRLRKGMRLQSDPTIVYGLVGGKGTLGRPIRRDEIRKPTPYNTYVINGLPPGPIANPGRASLEAVANPSQTNDLYFVADGTGGHAFAETLADHNRNVLRWRQIERERAAAAKAGEDGKPPAGGNGAPETDRVAPEPEAPEPNKRRGRGASLDTNPFGVLALPAPPKVASAQQPDAEARRAAKAVLAARLRAAFGEPSPANLPNRALALAPAAPAADKSPAQKAIKAIALKPGEAATFETAMPPGQISKPQAAAVPGGTEKPAPTKSPYAVGPGLAAIDLKIIGVTPDVTDSPLDGPINEDEDTGPEIDPSQIASVPMSAAKKAELVARARKYAGSATVPVNATRVPRVDPAGVMQSATAPAGNTRTARLSPQTRRIYDASEGTRFDPLKQKSWDLNATQAIPSMR